jgi:AcrR family transcriptional regulator
MSARPTTDVPRSSRAEREARVLDTAERLFYARGVHEVGMDELVQASGMGKATVYRLYPTKDHLIGAYLSRLATKIAAAVEARIAESPADARATLLAVVDDIAADLRRSDFRGCAFNNASVEFADPGHSARVQAREYRAYLLDTLTRLAEQLVPGRGARLGAQLAVVIDGCYTSAAHLGPDGPAADGLALARTMIDEA